ncbi:MAG: hypothetical protein ACYTFY_07945 [Planctomycetota bacterium]|jgi:hypothetical protein
MQGVYDFCGHYDWTFEWLRKKGGEELVKEYWENAISNDSQQHALQLISEKGFEGMKEYWGETLHEEGADCNTVFADGVYRSDMHRCPSLGFLLRNNLKHYHDYCNHCLGWVGPMLEKAGFKKCGQHNHKGMCWGEIVKKDDTRGPREVGEIAKDKDVRLYDDWQTDDIDTY